MSDAYAHHKVFRAIRDGALVRQPCARCGAEPTEAHHEDYAKPLDVIWLCKKCHTLLHRERGDLGRPKFRRFVEAMLMRFPEGTLARIDAVREPLEDRADFVRALVERELKHREAERPQRKRRTAA